MSTDPDPSDINITLLTISDTRSREDDESGQLLRDRLEEHQYVIDDYQIVREDLDSLYESFEGSVNSNNIDVIISSGGTGISSRDQTIEVVRDLLDKPLPGFGELFRQLSVEEVGAYTVMSRCVAGRSDDSLIIALPGSTNAVQLALEEIILEILPHMVKEINK